MNLQRYFDRGILSFVKDLGDNLTKFGFELIEEKTEKNPPPLPQTSLYEIATEID